MIAHNPSASCNTLASGVLNLSSQASRAALDRPPRGAAPQNRLAATSRQDPQDFLRCDDSQVGIRQIGNQHEINVIIRQRQGGYRARST